MIPCCLLDFACLNLDERANSNSLFFEARGKQQWYMASSRVCPKAWPWNSGYLRQMTVQLLGDRPFYPAFFFGFLCGSRCTLTATPSRCANTQTTSVDVGLRSSSAQRTDRI